MYLGDFLCILYGSWFKHIEPDKKPILSIIYILFKDSHLNTKTSLNPKMKAPWSPVILIIL